MNFGIWKNANLVKMQSCIKSILIFPAPWISESCFKINNLNFYFHTSLWYLKKIYEGLSVKLKCPWHYSHATCLHFKFSSDNWLKRIFFIFLKFHFKVLGYFAILHLLVLNTFPYCSNFKFNHEKHW